MASPAQVEEFRTATAELSSLAHTQIRDLLSAVSVSADPGKVRDLLVRVFPDFMTSFGDTSAVLGADFYDAARNIAPSAGTLQAVFAQPAKVKQSEGVARWAVGSLFLDEPDWDLFESQLLGGAQRLVLQPARQTIDLLSRADARSGKVAAVRWSRSVNPGRAKSGKSCDFCIMLAGRGPVYKSDAASGMVVGRGTDSSIALDESGNRRKGYIGGVGGGVKARGGRGLENSYHDNCHCVPVPTFYQRETRSFNVRGYERRESVLVPF